MIVFELICAGSHRFEGWFSSSIDFDAQKSRRLIACPRCGIDAVEKLPSAKIRTSEAELPRQASQAPKTPAQAGLDELINYVLMNTEDVGTGFADEARRIHREEAPRRSIRGVASGEQARELLEEGVPVMPLPIPPRGDWH